MMRSHLWRAAGFAVVIALAGCSNDAAVRRAPHREQRKVAVTFDDIPGVAVPRSQRCKVDSFVTMNRRLLATLKANRIPAFGLVTAGGACARVRRALPGIMDMWLDAGFDLGNHSFSHFDINGTPLGRYEADVARGAQAIEPTLHKRGKKLKYFRYPFLHAGKDLETKRGFESYLTNSGYGIAPVTIDNQEWVFAEAYARAVERRDTAAQNRIVSSYVSYMDDIFAFFEALSVKVTGYEIKQVLLLHANTLNADHFEKLAKMMRARGYSFITLDEALTDPAYRLPDIYAGPVGLSWLHRWGLAKGIRMTPEPAEPAFLHEVP